MTHASTKLLRASALTALGALALVGCGNDVPPNGVAKVGDSVISKDEFNKWIKTASAGQGAQGGPATAPDPPDFKKCVAAAQKVAVPKGTKKPTAAQSKKQCKQQYDQLEREVMQFLVQAKWVEQESEEQGVKVSDAEVKRSFADQKKQAFPTDKAYKDFLKSSGMTEKDILFRVRLDQLQQKLTQKVTKKQATVSDAEIKAYYDKNKKRFAQPERRDLSVVLTKGKAKAEEAKAALDGGQSWKQVSKKYSIDDASKSQGGKLPDVAKGQQEKALDAAVFKAAKGKVEGPIKTQFGWYVFEVDKVSEASQQTLAQAKETIRNLLKSQKQQKALDKFIKDFREEYKDKTICADDFRVAECKNAPKEKTESGPASGGTPGTPQAPQDPSQQAPQDPSQQAPQDPSQQQAPQATPPEQTPQPQQPAQP
jgi:foldase protein PrsA